MKITHRFIVEEVKYGRYLLSLHAEDERLNDKLTFRDLEEALLTGRIIESYPDDRRGPSCLVLGYTRRMRAVHIVCGRNSVGRLLLITVYVPAKPKWMDPETRNERE